jgi:hypothetical protein
MTLHATERAGKGDPFLTANVQIIGVLSRDTGGNVLNLR